MFPERNPRYVIILKKQTSARSLNVVVMIENIVLLFSNNKGYLKLLRTFS